jgi:GT2 family glycosyltransferase
VHDPGLSDLTLSVVIPTHRRCHLLPLILGPLLSDEAVDEVIVVVDGDLDGSYALLQAMASNSEKLHPLLRTTSGGAQRAREDGLKRATGVIVLFLDDDVLASHDLGEHHRALHQHREGVVGVGYMPVRQPESTTGDSFSSTLYGVEYEGRCEVYEAEPLEILRSLWWGNVSMRRADVLRVGLVSDGPTMLYHEDQDFGLRCLEAGLVGVFDRGALAAHLHHRDLDGFVRDAFSQGRGMVIVHERHQATMGPLEPSDFETGLGPLLARVVRLGSSPSRGRLLCNVLQGLTRLLGRCHLFGLQLHAAKLLRRVGQRTGAAMEDQIATPA